MMTGPVTAFQDWYDRYEVDERDGCLGRGTSPGKFAAALWHRYEVAKREMDIRVANYEKLEKLADGDVISPKPDLPNVSSGETAGLIRRIARSLVQNVPNVEVVSKFDDDSPFGVFSRHTLLTKIIGSDYYSNDMQQALFASTKSSLTLGFDCVIPLLLQDAAGGWYVKYDSIHYRDVFPDPGCRDIREATEVFVRRYLTKGEVMALINNNTVGWDQAALAGLLKTAPGSREAQSVDHQTKKRHQIPVGYEIITWYSSSGEPFLTFSASTKMLLRIEKNKHPLKQHPVHFLVMEKDDQQPLGKSQVELLIGRQDFQDLMLNGAMKLWYRNINPSIIGYGTINAVPNLSPGKYTSIPNPAAKIEPFEVNTQTLLQYGQISAQNLGSMVNLVGAPDQQMQAAAGNGMSATPQGVEAQQQVVDVTTNNYQKAIEGFVSHYCSYALTMFFHELAAVKNVELTADARQKLVRAGFPSDKIDKDGKLEMDFSELATEYWVRCVPGSLVELEDEKQLRILNALFVPLSQAMPAIGATQDRDMINQLALTMQYIVSKQIELSGASSAQQLKQMWMGETENVSATEARLAELDGLVTELGSSHEHELEMQNTVITEMQQQIAMLTQNNQILLEKLGVLQPGSTDGSSTPAASAVPTA